MVYCQCFAFYQALRSFCTTVQPMPHHPYHKGSVDDRIGQDSRGPLPLAAAAAGVLIGSEVHLNIFELGGVKEN